jgi:hypothetical protein
LLPDGRVLLAGGAAVGSDTVLKSSQLYDPTTGTWALGPSMAEGREIGVEALLPDGRVLVAGGDDFAGGHFLSSAELYVPGS